MAKGKGGKSKGYVSAGVNKNVNRKILNDMRNSRTEVEKAANIQKAWLNGSNPWVTIDNPNKEETNKRRIRVRMNDLMGGSAKTVLSKSFRIK